MALPPTPLCWRPMVGEPTRSGPVGVEPIAVEPRPLPNAASEASGRQRSPRLEQWFREYFDTLWRMALRLGVPPESVDDVVQEAFITADRRASDIAAGSERAFLVSTTVRLSANHRRRQRTRAGVAAGLARQELPDGPHDAEQLMMQKQLRSLLDAALDALPQEQRTVLVLHELDGSSAAEIAELLGDPPGTVASRLARARQKFSRAARRLYAEWQKHR